ncbi:Uncharacterized protein dnm_071920 [Desulfonema magnum]|uniref:Uncharacterized protein n=1 Tax=Desulfonema magnum TaxID=45655 RepID=A0A975BTC5_9BACT|nr:Uncharacterized protein dnm_071920 [Desulfonema magnum]
MQDLPNVIGITTGLEQRSEFGCECYITRVSKYGNEIRA